MVIPYSRYERTFFAPTDAVCAKIPIDDRKLLQSTLTTITDIEDYRASIVDEQALREYPQPRLVSADEYDVTYHGESLERDGVRNVGGSKPRTPTTAA